MAIKFPKPYARHLPSKPRDTHRQRIEAERERRAQYARMNVAIAQKLRSSP